MKTIFLALFACTFSAFSSGCTALQERKSKHQDGENCRERLHNHCRATTAGTGVAVNRGIVNLEGFDRAAPLTIPPQGLCLADALNAAGFPIAIPQRDAKVSFTGKATTPKASGEPAPVTLNVQGSAKISVPAGSPGDTETLIVLERMGQTYVTFYFVGRHGPLAGMPLEPNDSIRILANSDDRMYKQFRPNDPVKTLPSLKDFFNEKTGKNGAGTDLRFVMMDRDLGNGQIITCVYPRDLAFDSVTANNIGLIYDNISIAPTTETLRLDELPFMTDTATADLTRRVLTQARRRVPTNSAIQLPRLEPILPRR